MDIRELNAQERYMPLELRWIIREYALPLTRPDWRTCRKALASYIRRLKQYDELMRVTNTQWPSLKKKLMTGDENVLSLMQEYYDAFLVYEAAMGERKFERRLRNRAHVKLMNCVYGPIDE